MKLWSNNIIIVRLVELSLYYNLEIILQAVFRIWFCIGWEVVFWLDSNKFNWESTYSEFQHLPIFKVIGQLPHKILNKIYSKYATKKHGKYDRTSDLKTCRHISFEMLGSIFCPDCRYLRYLRYMDSKI